ncbi:trans-aconitate 2-methyltransferase [Lichenihabitans psoromatis]|uniref:trans-aconitate 2-methyltransferase n=1 Tax=Lichenihabitans psoromatis TaxID=2528642 RepID=UPI0010356131|nr:trans-aconitate 2-methyltransferase [Lichenihabitans psoromatis]
MNDWNPALYRQFEDERTRPARDLLARVDGTFHRIVDLGCGPGNSTELLARRFAGADILGIDTSAAMLNDARSRLPECRFELADIETWSPVTPPDLIYANASLQWLGDHATLVPRLFAALAPGGVLAVQMPDNRDEPSHRSMREVAAEPAFAAHLEDGASSRVKILPLTAYYDLVCDEADTVDVWRTTYHHPMADAAAIVSWVRSTGLRPFVDPLPDDLRLSFLTRYQARIDEAYRPRPDGRRLLAFPRLFFVAVRPSA